MTDLDDNGLRATVWAFGLERRSALRCRLANEPRSAEAENELHAVEDAMLQLQAPDLGAVITKLEMLWECHLDGSDPESLARAQILRDLRRLTA